MAWAIHRLHTESLTLNLEQINIVLVVLVVTRSLPEFQIEHVGGNYLLISSDSVLVSD